jgi:hypothetical protein
LIVLLFVGLWAVAPPEARTSAAHNIAIVVKFLDYHAATVTAFFTMVLAVFTYALWRSTDKLWRSATDTLLHAEKTTERQLRAYISITKVRIRDIVVDGKPKAAIRIINVGQTPAYNLTAYFAMGLYPFDQIPDLPPEGELSKVSLGSNQSIRHCVELAGILNQERMNAIYQGQYAIFVMGVVKYTDTFKAPQYNKIRLMYTHRGIERGSRTMEVCPEGNEET